MIGSEYERIARYSNISPCLTTGNPIEGQLSYSRLTARRRQRHSPQYRFSFSGQVSRHESSDTACWEVVGEDVNRTDLARWRMWNATFSSMFLSSTPRATSIGEVDLGVFSATPRSSW